MKTKQDYYALVAELEKIEISAPTRLYLTDECVDRENVLQCTGVKETDENFWNRMYSAACDAAGIRAEGYGIDINAAIGRVIY